jgi:hypothetical protein
MPNIAPPLRASMRRLALRSMTICALAAAASDVALAMGCTVQPPVVQIRCPPLRDYSPAQSIALGEARAALRAREPASILLTVVDDAFNLRERCRALEKKN